MSEFDYEDITVTLMITLPNESLAFEASMPEVDDANDIALMCLDIVVNRAIKALTNDNDDEPINVELTEKGQAAVNDGVTVLRPTHG